MAYSDQKPLAMGAGRLLLKRDATTVTLDRLIDFSEEPMNVSGTSRGSGEIHGLNSYDEGSQFTLTLEGVPLAAMALMLGQAAPVADGTTPDQSTFFGRKAGVYLPYFEMLVEIPGDDGDGIYIYLARCKLTKTGAANVNQGADFLNSPLEGTAMPFEFGTYGKVAGALYIHEETRLVTMAIPTPPA